MQSYFIRRLLSPNFLVFTFMIFLASLALSSCGTDRSPEEEIKEMLVDIEKSFEQRTTGDLDEYVAESYQDPYGNTKRALRRIAAGYVLRNPSIHILSKISDISVNQEATLAKVTVYAAVSSEELGAKDIRLLQTNAHLFQVSLRKSDDWLIHSIQWKRVKPERFVEAEPVGSLQP